MAIQVNVAFNFMKMRMTFRGAARALNKRNGRDEPGHHGVLQWVGASAPVVIAVVDVAIMVVVETDTALEIGIGILDHELVAEVHDVPQRVPGITGLCGGRGGRAEQYE
jgi:hypothetical protein